MQPYFTFQGQAAQAMDFYEKVFGCSGMEITRWSDAPESIKASVSEEMRGKVLYGKMTILGTDVMFSDTDPSFHAPETFAQSCFISLAIPFEGEEEVRRAYKKLLDGGKALMEIGPQFFAKQYAWVQDKFGVTWQLIYGMIE